MTTRSPHRGIITLAYGADRFVDQARSLAHSLHLHAPDTPRTLITDSTDPGLRALFTQVVPYRPEFGVGVRQKMYLDEYSPYDETLFIDSDCLVLAPLDNFWKDFAGNYFGVPGFRYLTKGATDPYMDVDRVLEALQLEALPKFNGGIYYFTKSPEAKIFFDKAREIMRNAADLGLREFRRNGPADEAVYSIAMAIFGVKPTLMQPGGMWTPTGYTGPFRLNAINGSCSFEKDGVRLTPEIVHFAGEYALLYAYARERARLRQTVAGEKTEITALAKAFAVSLLWQSSRRSAFLRRPARKVFRFFRNLGKARPAQTAPHEGEATNTPRTSVR